MEENKYIHFSHPEKWSRETKRKLMRTIGLRLARRIKASLSGLFTCLNKPRYVGVKFRIHEVAPYSPIIHFVYIKVYVHCPFLQIWGIWLIKILPLQDDDFFLDWGKWGFLERTNSFNCDFKDGMSTVYERPVKSLHFNNFPSISVWQNNGSSDHCPIQVDGELLHHSPNKQDCFPNASYTVLTDSQVSHCETLGERVVRFWLIKLVVLWCFCFSEYLLQCGWWYFWIGRIITWAKLIPVEWMMFVDKTQLSSTLISLKNERSYMSFIGSVCFWT